MAQIKICSFNCNGFSGSQMEILNLCASHHIICLQEIWLDKTELQQLNTFHPKFSGFGVTPVDPAAGITRGRKFGGVAFLWDKTLEENVEPINFGYNWLAGIKVKSDNTDIVIIGIYMPYDSRQNNDSF